MTRIVLDGITDIDRLVEAVARLLAQRSDTSLYGREELRYVQQDAQPFVPPTGYVRCIRRGTHRTLNECWMCWNDVMHGVTTERNVLAVDAVPRRAVESAVAEALPVGDR